MTRGAGDAGRFIGVESLRTALQGGQFAPGIYRVVSLWYPYRTALQGGQFAPGTIDQQLSECIIVYMCRNNYQLAGRRSVAVRRTCSHRLARSWLVDLSSRLLQPSAHLSKPVQGCSRVTAAEGTAVGTPADDCGAIYERNAADFLLESCEVLEPTTHACKAGPLPPAAHGSSRQSDH